MDAPQTLHATSIAHKGRALLILGPSGSGKSSLAIQLMALGAQLISDDCTILTPQKGALMASVPPPLHGKIEARGIGILAAEPASPAPIRLIADLGHIEEHRLPPMRERELLGQIFPLVHKSEHPSFAAALMVYLKGSRIE